MSYTLQQINFSKIDSEDFVEKFDGVFTTNNGLTNKVQIFWAQESDSKGKQLIFTDQELEDLEKVKIDFL